MSRWLQENPSKYALYMRAWRNTNPGKSYRRKRLSAGYTRKWRLKNKERYLTMKKAAEIKMKIEALAHYSKNGIPECVCCGEKQLMFLCLDHIANDGNEWRKRIGTQGYSGFYYWCKRNNYPEGLQTLCHNCNVGKRLNKGVCPHKK